MTTTVLSGVVIAPASASPTTGIGSDRARLAQLERQLEARGAHAQSLVSEFNSVESQTLALVRRMRIDHLRLLDERRAQAAAKSQLRHVAIVAYVNAATASSGTFTSSMSAQTLPEQQVYMGVASGSLGSAATALAIDQLRTTVTESTLAKARASDAAILVQLSAAQQAAQAATASDTSLIDHLSGKLLALVTVANARRLAARNAAAEKALAAAAQQGAAQHATTGSPPTPPAHVAPGGYANPLRSVSGLQPDRIDQGVDFQGFGPIYAIGNGVVLSTVNGGWPGGTFITYRLTGGAAAGLVVYAAEDINPAVQVGQAVTSNTVLGTVYGGPTGIETGWADSGAGDTMAAVYGQFGGSNTTAFGYNFSQLLQSLGAPGGIEQSAPSGSLPSGWPQW